MSWSIKSLATISPWILFLLALAAAFAAWNDYIRTKEQHLLADCYWDVDCGPTKFCARWPAPLSTTHTDRVSRKEGEVMNDGLCYDAGIKSNPFWDPVHEFEAVRIWFDAYLDVGLNGKGRLTPERVREIERQANALPHPNLSSKQIRNAVHSALFTTMGYDLKFDAGESWLVAIPKLRPQAVEIITSTREGFEAAIKANDPDKIVAPIERFWQRNPDFHPMHTGPCYAHGHKWIQTVTDQKNCQVNELKRNLSVLLGIGKPVRN